jgi:hypothetical protein
MILSSLNETRSIEVMTIAGKKKGIIFLGKTFISDKSYNFLDDAIAASKTALDLGFAIVITPNIDRFQLWVSMPHEIIVQAA